MIYWVWGPDSIWISFSSSSWLCLLTVSLIQGSLAPGLVRPRMRISAHVWLYKGKSGTVHFTEGVTDDAAYSLSSPLILLPPSAARNTPETATTYTGWEWCQSGCWLRVAGVCFSLAFHTLCTTLLSPWELVPLWAPLYHPSKSSPRGKISAGQGELKAG